LCGTLEHVSVLIKGLIDCNLRIMEDVDVAGLKPLQCLRKPVEIPKGSRSVRNHSPSSHRKVLFPEQSNEKETLLRTNEQKSDLVQGKVGSCVENDTAEHRVKCFSGNSHKEQSCQISERDMSLQEKCQEQEDVDVQICVSEMIKRESQHDILEGGKNIRVRIMHEDGGCNRNELSIKQHQAGNNDQKPTYKEDDGIETNANETMRQESETERQCFHQY
ncbi:hypothetical protein KI387_040994, partial [Taxus chinensis]